MDISGKIQQRIFGLQKRIESLINRYFRTYLLFMVLFALLGFALMLLFPLMVYVTGEIIWSELNSQVAVSWSDMLFWAALFILNLLLTVQMIRFKPVNPAGLKMQPEKIPEIIKHIEFVNKHFKYPRIKDVVITNEFELNIVKTPCLALPLWSNNTLVIGLPLLFCLSPLQFESMLARRMGQFSKRQNVITNWLYQLKDAWRIYCRSYGRKKTLDGRFMKYLIMAYSKLYSALAVYVVRQDEANADNYGMEIYHHAYMSEMMTAESVGRYYLKHIFWPAARKVDPHMMKPNRKLSALMHKILQGENLQQLVDKVFNQQAAWNSSYPSLKQRLDNIGYDQPTMHKLQETSAAIKYLGSSLNGVITLLDRLWLKEELETRKIKAQTVKTNLRIQSQV